MARYFQPGENVVLRYLGRVGGIARAFPARVVEDSPSLTVLHWPAGTQGVKATWSDELRRPDMVKGPEHVNRRWQQHEVLRLMFPGESYSVWAMWRMPGRQFAYWYVNLEEPFVRTRMGFDTVDHELDVVVEPDLSWWWKDEGAFEELIRAGVFSVAKGEQVREAGRHVIRLVEAKAAPFNEPWPEWKPAAGWMAPVLADGWDVAA